MKKVILLGQCIMTMFLLFGCRDVVLEQSLDELVPINESTEFDSEDGILRSSIISDYAYGVYQTNEFEVNDITKIYKRMFFPNHEVLQKFGFILEAISNHFEEINHTFEDPDLISYVVYNKDTNILALLPDDHILYTESNTILIDINDFITSKNDEGFSMSVDMFDILSSIDFRDICVAQLNAENSARSIDYLSHYLTGTNGWIDDEIIYIDIMIEYNQDDMHTTFVLPTQDDYIPYLGTGDRYIHIDQISISLTYVYDDNEHSFSDVLISSDEEKNIIFYAYD